MSVVGAIVGSRSQLWRFLVTSTVYPEFWAEEGLDEGELVVMWSRQLGGGQRTRTLGRQTC